MCQWLLVLLVLLLQWRCVDWLVLKLLGRARGWQAGWVRGALGGSRWGEAVGGECGAAHASSALRAPLGNAVGELVAVMRMVTGDQARGRLRGGAAARQRWVRVVAARQAGGLQWRGATGEPVCRDVEPAWEALSLWRHRACPGDIRPACTDIPSTCTDIKSAWRHIQLPLLAPALAQRPVHMSGSGSSCGAAAVRSQVLALEDLGAD